jgi:AcrR family transcriptional regulator
MAGAWLREEQADLAENKILDAAERAFIDLGVSRAGMGHIAKYAGCSRGTLYRYFKNRHELHLAYVARATRQISAQVKSEITEIRDPGLRLVESILRAVHAVRSNPGTAAWFETRDSGIAARMSRSSEVVDTASELFVNELLETGQSEPSPLLRARWFVRVVVSLLTLPGENEAEERALITNFVAPTLLRDIPDRASQPVSDAPRSRPGNDV